MPKQLRLAGLFVLVAVSAGCTGSGISAAGDVPTASTTATASEPLLSTRIILPAEVTSGDSVSGTLVLTNNTGGPVSITTEGGCSPKWAVGLENDEVQPRFDPPFTADCGARPLVVEPGTSELPFTLWTTFPTCTQGESTATAETPQCLPDGAPPPLPPGDYTAVLVSQAPDLPTPSPAAVRIVPA